MIDIAEILDNSEVNTPAEWAELVSLCENYSCVRGIFGTLKFLAEEKMRELSSCDYNNPNRLVHLQGQVQGMGQFLAYALHNMQDTQAPKEEENTNEDE